MLLAASTVVVSAYQREYYISTGQQIKTWTPSYPEAQAVVFYYPHEKGTRTVSIWHDMYINDDEYGITEYYWKDTSNPNDTWHKFHQEAFGFLFRTNVKLWSGSNTIGYKFVITNYDDDQDLFVKVKVY
ncbi:MAG: hypothetical protein WC178_04615 [Candidatus Paceibacterota bacterium]